jgi:cell division protein FtsA
LINSEFINSEVVVMFGNKNTDQIKQEGLITALDIGSASIITVIAERSYDDHLTLLGWGVAPSRGIKSGVIVNREAAIGAILESISAAEKMADTRITDVCVSISGINIETQHAHAMHEVSKVEILEGDIDYVVEQAGRAVKSSDQQILHLLPQYFTVDGQVGIKEPLNMVGDSLQANVHVILTRKSVIHNLVKTVQKAGLIVQDIVLSPLASSYSSLSEQAKNSGVCQIDLGEGSTGFCTFVDGMIRDTGVVPVGGYSITSDITQVLHVDAMEAQVLHHQYGKAMSSLAKPEDSFELKTCADEVSGKRVSKATLSAIIEARLEEVFALIKQQLINQELYPRLGAGIVLTGGGALLPGIAQLANKVFELPVKISRGSFIQGVPDELKSPVYSCALGLLCYSLQSKIDGVSISYALSPSRKDPFYKRVMGAVQAIFV